MDAKVQLSQLLNEVQVEGMEIYSNYEDTVNTADGATSGGGMTMDEKGSSKIATVLKGYVTYSTFDDGVSNVYVTIVSTPKTMRKQQRPAGDTFIADNLRDGLNTVLAEIQSGVVPPVGGRTITIPETGEMGLVGFGSTIIQRANRPAEIARQERIAERIAIMRAEAELRGIIAGDQVDGEADYRESVRQAFGDEALTVEEGDPVNKMVSENDFAD